MIRAAIISLALIACIAAGAGILYLMPGEFGIEREADSEASSSKSSLLGGPFSMVDHDGKAVTEADYAGRFMVVYFGYTFCPDVCPLGLQLIGEALEIFEEKGGDLAKVAPLFVTVDPERDTPEVLKNYLSNFHPSLRGLGGSVEQLTAMAKAYRAYFAKVKDETSSAEYLMDHTAITYLMGKDGGYVGHFSHNTSAENMAKKFLETIK